MSTSVAQEAQAGSCVSWYDPRCMSRTKLRDENDKTVASLACLGGSVWLRNEILGDVALADIPSDQMIATTMLLQAGDFTFAFVGFLKGGLDSFHAWFVENYAAEIFTQAPEARLKAFGAAHCLSAQENGRSAKVIIACGLGLKTIRVFTIGRASLEEPYVITYRTTVNCKDSVSALGFNASGTKLIASGGDSGGEVFFSWGIPDDIVETEKYRFVTEKIGKNGLSELFGCQRLADNFFARDQAFRNPKHRNDDLQNWESTFPRAKCFAPAEAPLVVEGGDVNEDDFEHENSSVVSVHDDIESISSARSASKRSRNSGEDENTRQQKVAPKGKRLRPQRNAIVAPSSGETEDDILKELRAIAASHKHLLNENRTLKQYQERTLGILQIMRAEQTKLVEIVKSLNRQTSGVSETPHLTPFPGTGFNTSPMFLSNDNSMHAASSLDLSLFDSCATPMVDHHARKPSQHLEEQLEDVHE